MASSGSTIKFVVLMGALVVATIGFLELRRSQLNNSGVVSKPPLALTTDTSSTRTKYEQQVAGVGDAAAVAPKQDNRVTEAITPDSLNVLVDKTHSLPQTYEPQDLILLRNLGIPTTTATMSLRSEAARALSDMLAVMKTQGLQINVISAYRSFTEQVSTNNMWQGQLGSEEAAAVSAPPGHSEHQLGTTIDIGIPGYTRGFSGIYPDGKASPEWKWLDQNAHQYGFVMSYRNNQQEQTGYKFEPWHWRYIGTELATQIRLSPNPPQSSYRQISVL